MKRPLQKRPFRSLFFPLMVCFPLMSILDLKAQHAYAANTIRRMPEQQDKDTRLPLEKRISLQVKNAKLAEVLEKIEQQSPYVFVFSNDDISTTQKISLNVKEKSLQEVLEMVLSPLDIRFELISDKIILKQGNAAAAVYQQQENVTVKGRVVSDNGEGIPGVNIRLESKPNIGTVTNEQGYFTLQIPSTEANGTLLATSVGFSPAKIAISGRTDLTILMGNSAKDLNEIVITAYGSQKKKDVTAAISTISTKDIEGRPVTNMFQALQGTAPNLTLQQGSAEPGTGMTLNIRGVGSLTGNAPLIIIDGVQSGNDGLQNLNPYDVESISVLKDAASSAIYGSQAANGVIYITTKRGKQDAPPAVQYNGMYGWQMPTTLPRQVEGWEYMTLKNEALVNSGKTPQYTPDQISYWKQRGSEPAYLHEMLRKYTPQQNHSINLTGGGKSSSYLLSIGYVNQGSMLHNSYLPDDMELNYKRYNARANVSVDISKWVKASVNLAYTKSYFNKQQADIGFLIRDAMRTPRIYPVKDSLGNYVVPALNSNNVIAQLEYGGFNRTDRDNLLGGVDVTITPVEHFKINLNASGNYTINTNSARTNKYTYAPYYTTANPPIYNQQSQSSYKDLTTNVYATAEYENTFNKHYVKGQVGVRSDAVNEFYGMRANRYGTTNLDPDWAIGGGYIPNADGTYDYATIGTYNDITNPNLYALNSLFGRVNYVYSDKYLAEFTWRYDGSSKLAPGHRWQFFPAFSLGWRVTDEAFMEDIKNRFGNLKLRYSWGQVGNSNIGGFNYLARVNLSSAKYPFNNTGNPGADFTAFNDLLEWEISTMSNYGVDVELFNNALTLSYDFFNKRTTGIYLAQVVPGTAGIGSSIQNVGEVENKGWEFAVTYRARTGQFNHSVSANLSDNLNRVIRFGQESIRGSDLTYIIREGFPIASHFVIKLAGCFKQVFVVGYQSISTVSGTIDQQFTLCFHRRPVAHSSIHPRTQRNSSTSRNTAPVFLRILCIQRQIGPDL